MKTIQRFEAFDGAVFDTADDCRAHDAHHRAAGEVGRAAAEAEGGPNRSGERRMIGEIRFIPSLAMVETIEDWSGVRSPARALRRRLRHRQNIVYRAVPMADAVFIDERLGQPTAIVAHPVVIERMKAALPSSGGSIG